MGAGVAGQFAGKSRVVVNLDHQAIGFEARAAIEAECVGVIEVAGVDPEAGDGSFPGVLDCNSHQCTT